jgi:hypothetical protein
MTEEIFDTELQEMFGANYQDDTKVGMARPKNVYPSTAPIENTAQESDCDSTEDADFSTVTETDLYAKLAELSKTALPYGILNGLFYWWYAVELIDASIAVPSMCVFACLFGLGIGKVVGWKR